MEDTGHQGRIDGEHCGRDDGRRPACGELGYLFHTPRSPIDDRVPGESYHDPMTTVALVGVG